VRWQRISVFSGRLVMLIYILNWIFAVF